MLRPCRPSRPGAVCRASQPISRPWDTSPEAWSSWRSLSQMRSSAFGRSAWPKRPHLRSSRRKLYRRFQQHPRTRRLRLRRHVTLRAEEQAGQSGRTEQEFPPWPFHRRRLSRGATCTSLRISTREHTPRASSSPCRRTPCGTRPFPSASACDYILPVNCV